MDFIFGCAFSLIIFLVFVILSDALLMVQHKGSESVFNLIAELFSAFDFIL